MLSIDTEVTFDLHDVPLFVVRQLCLPGIGLVFSPERWIQSTQEDIAVDLESEPDIAQEHVHEICSRNIFAGVEPDVVVLLVSEPFFFINALFDNWKDHRKKKTYEAIASLYPSACRIGTISTKSGEAAL